MNNNVFNFLSEEDEIPSFEDVRNSSSFREVSNGIALENPFGRKSAFYRAEYEDDNIDFQKLVNLILARKDVLFNWKDFIGYTTKTIKNVTSFGEEAKFDRMAGIPTSYTITKEVENENPLKTKDIGERVLQLNGRLNKERAIVNIKQDDEKDLTNGLEFEFNYKRLKVSYKLHYYYEGRKRVYEKDNKDNIAFTISSSEFEDFEDFIKISKLKINENSNFKAQIKNAFISAIKEVYNLPKKKRDKEDKLKFNSGKFIALDWLFSKIPRFVALDLDFKETLSHVFQLDEWDGSISIGRDTTQSITTILSRLNPIEVYDYFYENPQKLIDLIIEFDDDTYTEQFFLYLTAIASYKQEGKDIDDIRTFNLNENTHIETNILYGDEEGKVELTNEFQLPVNPLSPVASLFIKDIEINKPKNGSNQLHPLDLIYIQRYDPILDEAIKVPSVAIYGKYLGDRSEWADVLTATFAVIDLVSILLSAGALSAGVRGIARIFAIIDISVSTINLAILEPRIKGALIKTDAGKWFVAHWPLISFCVSSGMISVYLAKGILKYGNQVKSQVNNKRFSENIDELMNESRKVVDEGEIKKPVGGNGPLGEGEEIGKFSKRRFNPEKAGGKILNLSWKDVEITQEGIEIVKKHLSRFEDVEANRKMISRLEKIENGEIPVTDWDKRFYTHEIREFERYKNLGYENTKDIDIPSDVWNDAHTATLEDYKLSAFDVNKKRNLYHPDVEDIDFFSDSDRELLKN